MTDHPQQLYAVEFTEADQARLVGFSCGEEKWCQHVSEWILGSDVIESMKRGTRVWLFETAHSEVVGFGSIGTTRWQWPPPRGARATLVIIPMLGLDSRFHGQPPDPAWRYSRQIMSHLLAEGQRLVDEWDGDLAERPQWMVLLVHQDNRRAIQFYEQCGFELIPNVVRRNDHSDPAAKFQAAERLEVASPHVQVFRRAEDSPTPFFHQRLRESLRLRNLRMSNRDRSPTPR